MKIQQEGKCKPTILYPAKLSFNLEEEIKTFQNKETLKHFMSTKFVLPKILKEIKDMEENEKQSKI
jgi:hypothetical protein